MAQMNGSISERVIREVSKTADSDALSLPPLNDAVDPDALDSLVPQMSDGEVVFTYAGYEVTVSSTGTIRLDDRQAG